MKTPEMMVDQRLIGYIVARNTTIYEDQVDKTRGSVFGSRAMLLEAGLENLFAVVRSIKGGRDAAVPDFGYAIIGDNHPSLNKSNSLVMCMSDSEEKERSVTRRDRGSSDSRV